MTEEYTEKELILLDTALTDFLRLRKKQHRELTPYKNLQKKIWKQLKEQKMKKKTQKQKNEEKIGEKTEMAYHYSD